MASLAESLADLQPRRIVRCGVARLIATLEPSDVSALMNAIDNPNISASTIADALRKNGHQLSGDSIRRHRNRQQGGCLCSRET